MIRTYPRSLASVALASALSLPLAFAAEGGGSSASASASADGMRIDATDKAVSVRARSGPVLEYAFADVPFKPYAKSLYTPAGIDVLRDAPFDHLHHHALMYAIKVEDVTFWGETEGAGREVPRGIPTVLAEKVGGLATVTLRERLDWIAPGKGSVLLEERTVRAHDPSTLGATLLTWTSVLHAPEGKASVKLGGDHYYGLGARFLVSMDKDGKFIRPEKGEGEIVRGDERLTPGRWCAYTAKADGKPVTVAMFDSPSNPRKALWFTMQTPFAYLSATVNLWREPMALETGKPLGFTYGVAAWDGEAAPETIEGLYRKWVEISATKAPAGK